MNQIDRYTLLEQFHKEPYQTIFMAIHKEKDQEVALVNRIDKNGPLSETSFQQLVRHLSNVTYCDNNDQFVLITTYNEGMPLGQFIEKMRPSDEDRLQLLSDILRGFSEYDNLPSPYKSALMDSHQLVVHKSKVFMNEVIFLKHLTDAPDYHIKIREIVDLLFTNSYSPIAKHLLAFFHSASYLQIESVKIINQQSQKILQGDTMVLIDAVSGIPTPMLIAVDPQPELSPYFLEESHVTSSVITPSLPNVGLEQSLEKSDSWPSTDAPIYPESPVVPVPVTPQLEVKSPSEDIPAQKTEVHIGLTEKRSETSKKTSSEKKRVSLPWLSLILMPIVLFGLWYVFLKEETPPQPFASYQVVASKSGWTMQSNSIAYEPASISEYSWKILFEDQVIAESDKPEFSFKPEKPGDYQIILTVTDNYQQVSKPFINVLNFNGTFDTQEPTTSPEDASKDPLGGIEPSTTPGDVIEDTAFYHTSPNSQRLYLPKDKRYGLVQEKDIFVSKGDVMTIWVKTSEQEAVELYLVGLKNGKKVYEQSWQFSPTTSEFEKVMHTFQAHGLDSIELYAQSINSYIWFDSYKIETIK